MIIYKVNFSDHQLFEEVPTKYVLESISLSPLLLGSCSLNLQIITRINKIKSNGRLRPKIKPKSAWLSSTTVGSGCSGLFKFVDDELLTIGIPAMLPPAGRILSTEFFTVSAD